MTDSQPNLPLAAEFPVATQEQWQALAGKALRGKPVSSLRQRTHDGIEIDPLYTRAADLADTVGTFPFTRSTSEDVQPWEIRQAYALAQPADCNQQILHELERGVNGIHLQLSTSAARSDGETCAAGVQIDSAEAIAATLDGVLPGMVTISLDAGYAFSKAAQWLLEWLDNQQSDNGPAENRFRAALGADPLGYLATSGQLPESAEQALQAMAVLAEQTTQAINIRAVAIDTSVYHNAGANNVQELGWMLATGKQYLQALLDQGIPIDVACQQIECRLCVDADFFVTAAKLRAARSLWAMLCKACGATEKACTAQLQCSTSQRMLARPDPWVNMLRTTVACAGAAIGGADSISVDSFDAAASAFDKETNEIGRRVARNTQVILQEESSLHRVVDPIGGSGYAEHLTQELSRLAWDEFRAIEACGSMLEALRTGYVQEKVDESWANLSTDVRRRKQTIVGVSEFANTEEPAAGADRSSHLSQFSQPDAIEAVKPLPRQRLSEAFEAIRQQVEQSPSQVPVYTAVIGTPAEYLPRVQFSRNLLAAGGFSMTATTGVHNIDSMLSGLAAHDNKTVILCTGSSTTVDVINAAIQSLADAGASSIFVAAKPPADASVEHQLPAHNYLYRGCDAVDLLERIAEAHGLKTS